MSLVRIAWRSIQQRRLASGLTALSMGLGVALVVAVLVIYAVVDQAFRRGGGGYELIVGPKGGDLELVLNAAYYLREPTGTIPYSYYEEFTTGQFATDAEWAIPICMGHSYRDFPVVGTIPDIFERLVYYERREYKKYEFAEGENFKQENLFDAVVGSTVARQLGLTVGDRFQARHGMDQGARYHKQDFTVVGVLTHTGTPNDRALFVNMEGFYQIHAQEHAALAETDDPELDHDPSEADHAAETGDAAGHDREDQPADDHSHGTGDTRDHHHDSKAISAILVRLYDPVEVVTVQRAINDGPVGRAVNPSTEIAKLFEGIVGNIQLILLLMAVLIVVVAGLGIMVSIYNSMSERRHEIAVMRALGASRVTVMLVILAESILLSLGGGVLGLAMGHGLIGLMAPVIVDQTGVNVGLLQFQLIELVLIPGLVVLASVVGYLPAMTAYRTDVARALTATP